MFSLSIYITFSGSTRKRARKSMNSSDPKLFLLSSSLPTLIAEDVGPEASAARRNKKSYSEGCLKTSVTVRAFPLRSAGPPPRVEEIGDDGNEEKESEQPRDARAAAFFYACLEKIRAIVVDCIAFFSRPRAPISCSIRGLRIYDEISPRPT